MFEKACARVQEKPCKTRCEYPTAIVAWVAGGFLVWADGMRKYPMPKIILFLFAAFFVALGFWELRQYYFTEKRIYVKILGIQIKDVSRRDIMQLGIIRLRGKGNHGARLILVVLQTAAKYTPDCFSQQSYLSRNKHGILQIPYRPEYDAIIQKFYGAYDFIEK